LHVALLVGSDTGKTAGQKLKQGSMSS